LGRKNYLEAEGFLLGEEDKRVYALLSKVEVDYDLLNNLARWHRSCAQQMKE